jgi:deoxyribonuclease IV
MTTTVKGLSFGTAGVPDSTPQTSTLSALSHLRAMGLDGLEMEFVRGVKIGPETAAKVRQKAEELGLLLSAHAPYYVNLNSVEIGTRLQSQEHLLRSARMAALCGARSVVFHAGYYGPSTPEETYGVIRKALREVLSILKAERNPAVLRIETMGKRSQFGTLDEVVTLCQDVEGLAPCLDFSHLHAREGKANTHLDFHRILRKIEKRLGRAALRDLHVHLSGIAYNEKGEIKHLNLADSDFRFGEWIGAVTEMNAEGLVICESPDRENDALTLKRLYEAKRLKS